MERLSLQNVRYLPQEIQIYRMKEKSTGKLHFVQHSKTQRKTEIKARNFAGQSPICCPGLGFLCLSDHIFPVAGKVNVG